MSRISAQYVDGLEFRIKELGEQVEKLTKERDEYRLKYKLKADKADTYSREASTHEDTIEFATEYALNTANYLHQHFFDDVPQWRPLDDLIGLQTQISNMVTGIGEQLATLAEQNEKFRETLSRWRYQNLSYNWCCGNCGAVDGDEHKEGCVLSLPNLATPVLNRIRAEGMRMAADLLDNPMDRAAAQKIRTRSDEMEKTYG